MATQFTQEELQNYIDNPDQVDASDTDLVNALASAELATLGVTEGEGEALGLKPKDESDESDEEAKKIAAEAIAEAEALAAADKAKEGAEAKAKADAEAATKATGTDVEGKDARVLTKDGKNTLPFEVLQEARGRAAGAEAALMEAQETVVALAARLKALEAGKADPGTGEAATVRELEDKLKELDSLGTTAEDEAPWLKGMRTLVETVKTLQSKVDGYENEREEKATTDAAQLRAAANAALEGNPTLVLWKSQATDLFDEAVALDKMLRSDPAQSRRFPTFESRFERVVKLVRANHEGEAIPLPEPVADPAKNTKPSAADIQARAAAALKKAEDNTAVRTLTDIPGGEGEVTAEEQLARMSATDLAARFAGMTPQQVVDFTMTH